MQTVPTSVALAEVRQLAHSGRARMVRESAEITLSEVARDVGVDPSTISRWERGLDKATGDQALRWLRLLRLLPTFDATPH